MTNPLIAATALLKPQMPGVYNRSMIYDPTWDDPSYNAIAGQKIIPAPWSVVRDSDNTPLWVTSVDPVTNIPSYTTIPLSLENDNVVSLLNYGNSLLRLYTDNRSLPYPATPDPKCIFIGKTPRFYTLIRYPNTAQESVISQYFDNTGKLTSPNIPLVSLDSTNSSWYLPRCHLSVLLDPNEEIGVKIYGEDGSEIYSALLFTKSSAVVNQDVLYSPTIIGMTITGNQQRADGSFFLYEKQDFESLGLTATLLYDNGTTSIVPVDGTKCILYGQSDFIASFAGLQQTIMVKYFRSEGEAITPSQADATGQMITADVSVTVIPNTLGITSKILAIPFYNSSLAKYQMRYWMYFGDGRSHLDVTAYASITTGKLVGDSSYFGVDQTYVVSVDMMAVDPTHYPTPATYSQTMIVTFFPPTSLVRWTVRDNLSSPQIMGGDTPNARRPLLKYDGSRKQYFIPSTFTNLQAFLQSFYTQTTPPYDPSVAAIPQTPTHFVIRNITNGAMLVPAPIPVSSYLTPFTVIGDQTGQYVNAVLAVEFLNVVNSSATNVLFGVPVDVSAGSFVG